MSETSPDSLPNGFQELAPFAATWGALHTKDERYRKRRNSPMAEIQGFYDAVAPRLDAIFDHLDRFPMNDLPEAEALLYRTVLGLTEAALAVEIFRQPGVPHAPDTHSVTTEWNGME